MVINPKRIRYKQMDKAVDLMQNPDTIASLKVDDSPFTQVVFIPNGQEEEYKQQYGDKLKIWFDE